LIKICYCIYKGEKKVKKTLMGNEAIALALVHANIDMVSGYPGTPSSEILTTVQKIKFQNNLSELYAEWGTNEKVGFEVAYAGAIAGKRACATMKQVGLNVASDALMSASYIGNLAGFVVISADDPGFHSSQTEQDSRMVAKMAHVPTLDPSTPQDAYDLLKIAFEISEKFETPLLFRPVMRVCHAREIVEVEDEISYKPREGNFIRDVGRWAAVPRAGRFQQGLEQIDRIERIKEYNWQRFIEPKTKELKGSNLLIIGSGTGYVFSLEAVSDLEVEADVLKIDMPYPLPVEKITNFAKRYDKILIVEETNPCIEEQLCKIGAHGKLDGYMHKIDEMKKEHIYKALKKLNFTDKSNPYTPTITPDDIPPRPPNLCPGCPHRDIFFAIMEVFKKKKSIYPSDIGCYTLGLNQGAIDTVLCMGGSVSMASGFSIADKNKTVVATIGDSTFFHSGVAPLVNAVYQKHKFILVILDNSVVAMTGRQTTPERANKQVDILKVAEGCGAECYEHVYSNNLQVNLDFFKDIKKKYEASEGPIVVVVREFCVLDKERAPDHLPGEFATVDKDACVACDKCVTSYKCPPMSYDENGKMEIDPFLCIGCGACIDDILCPTDAFIEDKR
jgi:indolepyruvate ferredoxin oxidoreductase alpha subunit